MSIIITNDIETMGYICYEDESNHDCVLAMIWVRDKPFKKILFHTKKYMFDAAKLFLASAMTDYSDYHRAKALMFVDYLAWYNCRHPNA